MTNEEGLDMLQAAVVAVNDTSADLIDLVNESEELLGYCQGVCNRLMQSKKYMSSEHEEGDEPGDELVEFIKFLQYIKENKDVSEFEHEMLTDDVSVYTARRCLEHVLSRDYRSPILKPFAPSNGFTVRKASTSSLPSVQSNEKLVKDMVMIMHARQCEDDDCGQKYCGNMKEFLAQTDALSWDEAEDRSGDHLYLKQLEKHVQECRKPSCYYCSTVNESLESQKEGRVRVTDSSDSLASLGSQSTKSVKARANRSVSMPPRPDAMTVQQTQMMYGSPYLWAPQYPMGYYPQMQSMYPPQQNYGMPMMQTGFVMPQMQPQDEMEDVSETTPPPGHSRKTKVGKVKKSRMKAYSTPIRPNIEMEDDEDD
eukprot:m.56525 g.56525  ORF g.56525 m.56525 type:complete len:368 (-) comp7802_c1_seq1:165-1268(-)